jgi:hypothetical protein
LDFEKVLVSNLVDCAALPGKKISLGREAQGYSQKVLAFKARVFMVLGGLVRGTRSQPRECLAGAIATSKLEAIPFQNHRAMVHRT